MVRVDEERDRLQNQNKTYYNMIFSSLIYIIPLKGTQSAMGPRWPGHYFCQFEKRLPQPEIKSTHWTCLEIHFNPA